jgi:hypothetical protein
MTVDEIIDNLLEQLIQPGEPTKAVLTYGPAIPIAAKKKEEEEEEPQTPLKWNMKGRDFLQDCNIKESIDVLKRLYFE